MTKTVTLRYFASIREALGESETLTTDAATLGALRDMLIARGGAHAQVLGRGRPVRMALNQAMAREDQPLPDGSAEVAFFPPVTGG